MDGEMIRAAYSLHPEDDDYGQPGTLVRQVLSEDDKANLVSNVVGHLGTVEQPILDTRWRTGG